MRFCFPRSVEIKHLDACEKLEAALRAGVALKAEGGNKLFRTQHMPHFQHQPFELRSRIRDSVARLRVEKLHPKVLL